MSRGTPGTYLEIEVKLDAEPAFVLPDLGVLPGVADVAPAQPVELEAVYLDTEDLALLRGGVTLRRRTGGADAGWHLKLPAAEGRLEVRRAAGRSVRTVPPQLTGLVRARLRGAPVAPVARIMTRRTEYLLRDAAGAALAVVSDDDVTAETFGHVVRIDRWRELEIELAGGDPALLESAADLLVAAGARPAAGPSKLARALGPGSDGGPAEDAAPGTNGATPSGEVAGSAGEATAPGKPRKAAKAGNAKKPAATAAAVALAHLTEQVAVLVAADPQVRLDAEDSVHRMRVATRRLRSALATFRPLFADGAVDPLRAELKWLGEVLGKARDAEVMRARLRAEIAAQPVELVVGPVARHVDTELRKDYRAAHRAVVRELDGDRYLALLAALDTFLADPPLTSRGARPAGKELRRLTRKACRRVAHRVAASTATPDRDHLLHDVRKAAKRARYAAEAVRPVFGADARAVATAMEDVQELLGDFQDSVVERAVLRDLAMRAHLAGQNAFTYGRLHALAEARARHDEEEFAVAWRRVRKTLRRWPG